jgi:hypothetical protein
MSYTNRTIAALLTVATTVSLGMAAEKSEFKQYLAPAKDKSVVEEAQPSKFKWGGDIRLRTVYFDHIPYANGAEARGGANSFQRYRTRLFGEYHATESAYLRARLVNEFRTVQKPDGPKNSWEFPDELVFDNLFIDAKSDMFDVRVGRQDMIYGTGKLILDGTPKDGSRTIYFDAAKATYKGIADTTVDLFGMYTHAKDPLAINDQDRDIVGYAGGNAFDGYESGGGIYAKNKTLETLPWEAYYIYKGKEQDVPFLNNNPRNVVGGRLMPKGSGVVEGNVEMAYQWGDDISAYMIDALASWHIQSMAAQKACLGLGWYYISGDDPDSTKDEGWNPLFARWPQYSELYVYAFDTQGAGRWSNVSMPHVDFSIVPTSKLKSDILLGYMMAPEADGAGGGTERGLLLTWWNRFTIAEKLLSERDKLGGHFLLEVFDPGDYYAQSQQDETAFFARFEINYAF